MSNEKKYREILEKYENVIIIGYCALFVIISFFLLAFSFGFENVARDGGIYINMSYDPIHNSYVHEAPYEFRLLTPTIVYGLPFDHQTSFLMITLVALILTSCIFYFYLKKLGFDFLLRFLGITLLMVSPVFIYQIKQFLLIDPISWLVWILALYLLLIKNYYGYFIVLIFGIFSKETILLSLPLFIFIVFKENGLKKGLLRTLPVVPVVVLFLLFRYFIDPAGQNYISINYIIQIMLYQSSQLFGIFRIFLMTFLPFGIIWFIFMYYFKSTDNSFIKNSFILLPFILAQLVIVTTVFRVIFVAFPIIIPVFLFFIRDENSNSTIVFFFSILSFLSAIISWVISFLITYPEPHFISFAIFSFFTGLILLIKFVRSNPRLRPGPGELKAKTIAQNEG